jgi:hypothetical protein
MLIGRPRLGSARVLRWLAELPGDGMSVLYAAGGR